MFTDTIIKNLGKSFTGQKAHNYKPLQLPKVSKDPAPIKPKSRVVKGVDIFIESDKSADVLGRILEEVAAPTSFQFKVLSCRGVKVYPNLSLKQPDLVDQLCARFVVKEEKDEATDEMIIDLLQKLSKICRWVHLEKLNTFDGKIAYSKTHGEG